METITSVVPENAGTHNHWLCMSGESWQQAPAEFPGDTVYGSRLAREERLAGTTYRQRRVERYASPSVSNIAALIASAADLPAQITNCSAG